ncbi:hypothetical protein QE152_g20727 [Popillia japonica]|uniref:Uncharacterized protein n=1 Tax=Popillia japonica TaxID=7064 RepID=A0AAW1KP24_POPJA
MQNPTFSIHTVIENLEIITRELENRRTDVYFETIITSARQIATGIKVDAIFPEIRQRLKKMNVEYEGSDEPLNDPKQNFKVYFFFSVLDTTISSVKARFLQLKQPNEDFKVLLNISKLKEWNNDDLLKHC